MKEVNVYEFKPEIKEGIMKTIYIMNGLLNEVDFSMLNRETIDMYLDGCLSICSSPYKKHKRDKIFCGLIFNGKQFRGWVYDKNKEELEERLSEYTVDFLNPKYSIVEVVAWWERLKHQGI